MTPAETPTECEAEKENFTGLRRVRKGWEKGRCKSCGHEYYVDGDDPMDSVAEYAEHSLHAHRLIAAKDARIRELQATVQSAIRIYRQVESERRPNGKGLSPFFFGQRLRRLIREWVELSEAALARSEGGGA